MNTFEKDGKSVEYTSDLSGYIRIRSDSSGRTTLLHPGFLQAWLSHAGYVLVPKESMAGGIASILANYDSDGVEAGLRNFLSECERVHGKDDTEEKKPTCDVCGKRVDTTYTFWTDHGDTTKMCADCCSTPEDDSEEGDR